MKLCSKSIIIRSTTPKAMNRSGAKMKKVQMNWAGVKYTTAKGLSTTPGDTYSGGICICGHSAASHSAQGHFTKGQWQCWKGRWYGSKKPLKFLLTALPCGWHEFVLCSPQNYIKILSAGPLEKL
jgi:hypothetical protein